MTDPPLRLFVALEVPAAVRSALAAWGEGVVGLEAGLRPVAADGLHVTLCFLGGVSASLVPEILAACAVVEARPAAELSIGQPLWLPRRRPHVLAVSLSDAGGRLAAAQSLVAGALADGGFYEPEARPFLPHVTVARVRRAARIRARELSAPEPTAFVGETVTLFESRLGGGGARYEALGSVALGGRSG